MGNSCLETTTHACIHWLAVKYAVILCSDMSRKIIPTISSISRNFYALFFFTSAASSTTILPVWWNTAGLINSLISPFLQDAAKMVNYNTEVFPVLSSCAKVCCEKNMKILTRILFLHSKAREVF